MNSQQINNRLHRSGAIDFNCRFAENHVKYGLKSAKIKKRYQPIRDDVDNYSVTEGEPLYTNNTKRIKLGNRGSAPQGTKYDMELLSSLNNASFEDADLEKRITDYKANNNFHTIGKDAQIDFMEKMRDEFFRYNTPMGVAVSPWHYSMLGRQGSQFVATFGGLNTLYVDADVEAGDTLVVDLPMDEASFPSEMECTLHNDYSGFVAWQPKRGVPPSKKTLVIRPMPSYSTNIKVDAVRENMIKRGQVLGKCVRSARKGERCDLVMTGNSIGTRNGRSF